MNKPEIEQSLTDQRMMLRLLKCLVKAPAIRDFRLESEDCLLTGTDWGTIAVKAGILERLTGAGAIELHVDTVVITATGKQLLQSLKAVSKTGIGSSADADQHLFIKAMRVNGQAQAVMVNASESPLALLYRMNKITGRRFLSDEEFQAGERLRADFTRGTMLPRTTANWDSVLAKRARGERGCGADISDHALDCRGRVEKALQAVGPELSGVLLDICCFLKGLELVERERSWPARSAKMLLKTALSILHRHYTGRMKGANSGV